MPTTAPADLFAPFQNDAYAWLADHCPSCVKGCRRSADALTAPSAVTWRRRRRYLDCAYECESCGTCWSRADLYRAADIGALAAPETERLAA